MAGWPVGNKDTPIQRMSAWEWRKRGFLHVGGLSQVTFPRMILQDSTRLHPPDPESPAGRAPPTPAERLRSAGRGGERGRAAPVPQAPRRRWEAALTPARVRRGAGLPSARREAGAPPAPPAASTGAAGSRRSTSPGRAAAWSSYKTGREDAQPEPHSLRRHCPRPGGAWGGSGSRQSPAGQNDKTPKTSEHTDERFPKLKSASVLNWQ